MHIDFATFALLVLLLAALVLQVLATLRLRRDPGSTA
jgi:hypothetical protein